MRATHIPLVFNLLVPVLTLASACADPTDTDTDTAQDTDTVFQPVPATDLAGVWVGTEVDVLNRIGRTEGAEAMGDCEAGDGAVCDSVLELTDSGTLPDESAEFLQFYTTELDNLYRGVGAVVDEGRSVWFVRSPDGERAAVLIWTRGAEASLSVHMKDRYTEDPRLPERRYDATALDGLTFTGTTYTFAGAGEPDVRFEGDQLTISASQADRFSPAAPTMVRGHDLVDPAPELTYDAAAIDGWLGIYSGGANLATSGDDLLTEGDRSYSTVVAIPSREGTSVLLVTCDGTPTTCGDGAGGRLPTWDLSRYAFSLLTR